MGTRVRNLLVDLIFPIVKVRYCTTRTSRTPWAERQWARCTGVVQYVASRRRRQSPSGEYPDVVEKGRTLKRVPQGPTPAATGDGLTDGHVDGLVAATVMAKRALVAKRQDSPAHRCGASSSSLRPRLPCCASTIKPRGRRIGEGRGDVRSPPKQSLPPKGGSFSRRLCQRWVLLSMLSCRGRCTRRRGRGGQEETWVDNSALVHHV